ncbi:hypothetical protein MMC28_007078 [Mycoblastus sanguinarius]|nr:hypothetical protein [Mycoblastus sanguinarius]
MHDLHKASADGYKPEQTTAAPRSKPSDIDSSCAESFQKLSIKLQYTTEPPAETDNLPWSSSEILKLVRTIQYFKYRGRTTDEENIWDDAAKKFRWRKRKRSGFECRMVWNQSLEAQSEVDGAFLARMEWIRAGFAESWASLEAWEEREAGKTLGVREIGGGEANDSAIAMAAAAGNKD